jgi:hypothetical protein
MIDLDIKLKDGYRYEIDVDTDPISPRDPEMNELWNKVITFHGRYNLSDEHDYDKDDYSNWEELEEAIVSRENPICMLPVYMYDHGGIRINTAHFGCKWDSGQIGFIFANTKTIDNKGMSPNKNEHWNDFKDRLEENMRADIDEYDLYVSGQTYMLSIFDEEDNIEESISGFLGSDWDNNGLLDYLNPYRVKIETVADL